MHEKSRFYPALVLLILLNLVIKPIWIFAIDRNVQNSVGHTEYGLYFSLYNLSILFNFLLDWGFTGLLNREAATTPAYSSYTQQLLRYKLLFTIGYSLFLFLFALITGVTRMDILAGMIALQVLTSFFLFFRSGITAAQAFSTDAWLSITDKSLVILACGAFLLYPAFSGSITIFKFIWIQVACMGIAVVISFFLLPKRNGISFFLPAKPSIDIKLLFNKAWPYSLIILLMSVHYRLDGFLMERILPDGQRQAGIYASAYRLLDAANMAGFLLASFLLPYISRRFSEKKEIETVILNVRHLLLLYSLGIACIGLFASGWLVELLYHFSIRETILVMQYCLPAIIGYSLVHIYGSVLTATGHIRGFCIITAMAVALNIILNVLLIPAFGARGACIAALISQSSCGIAAMFYVRQQLSISLHPRSLFQYALITAVLVALFYYGQRLPVQTVYLVVIAAIVSILLMITTRLFRPSIWLNLFPKSPTGT